MRIPIFAVLFRSSRSGRRRRGAGARRRVRAGVWAADRSTSRPTASPPTVRATPSPSRGTWWRGRATSRSTPTGSRPTTPARPGAIDRIEAEGNVRFVQEGGGAFRAGHLPQPRAADRPLRGATLRQGQNTVRGETLTIFLRENRSVVTGGKDGGRVQAVINPKGILETSPK